MKYVLIPIIIVLNFRVTAQENADSIESPFLFEASYIGDNINNLSGGIKKGSTYLGFANLFITFNTQNAKLWKGGLFYIHGADTHGNNPSVDLIGDFQVVSNIEAGNHTYLQELWYKQKLNQFEITIGLQDLNAEIAITEGGSIFLNSSFGVLPSISANVSSPIFPLTSLGLTAKWSITDKSIWLAAIYDGKPAEFEQNPYNLNWKYNNGDGILVVSEFQQYVEINSLPGTYKLGVFNHNYIAEKVFNQGIPDSINYSIVGGYIMADQKIWQNGSRNLGIFGQLGISPIKYSINNYYIGAGLNYFGLFSKKGDDALGLALAHVHFNDGLGSESTLELTYFNQITENIFLQPDIQYIINPMGTGSPLPNAFALNLRFGFNF